MADEIRISDELIIQTMQGVIDNFLKPKFIELEMNATGQWLNTLEARAVNGNGEIWGMDYTYWLANGRAPNKETSHNSLVKFATWMSKGNSDFKSWLAVRGLTEHGFAIAYKIGEKGTEYYPEGTDLLTVFKSPEVINYIYSQFQEAVTVQINILLKKQLDDNFS